MDTTLRPLGIERRLRWLLVGRLVIAVCGMATILAGHLLHRGPRVPPPASAAYYTLLAACALNLVYLIIVRWFRRLRLLAWIQIILDVAVESLLVYFTGVDGVFAYLYFASVIAAAMILSGRASLFVASLATVMLSAAFIAHFAEAQAAADAAPEAFDPRPRVLVELNALVVHLCFFALSLHVVALLAGRLAAEVSRVRILNDEILQNMVDGIVTVDRDGRVTYVNPPARRMLGWGPDARVEEQPLEALGAEPVARALTESLKTGERVETELRVPAPDGDDRPVDLATSVLREAGGAVRGVVAILHDATLRETVAEMEKRAERFRALVEMSAGMAHEIRNPLASIRGAAQALRGDEGLRPEDQRLLGIVIRESDRLDGLVDSFLRFARNQPPRLRDADVGELVREVATLLRSRPDASGVAIAAAADGTGACRCDPDQVKQVLLNLGLNALEAVTEAGPRIESPAGAKRETPRVRRAAGDAAPRIRLRSGRGGPRKRVWIEVEDNGPGIAAAHWDRVFEPFFSTKTRGTGMGLAVARRIIEAHGGDITFETGPERGTTFRIELPV